jgi:hypothetical protein
MSPRIDADDTATHDALLARQPQALALLRGAGILPILTVDSVDQARAMTEALLAGGLTAIELTLRTPAAQDFGRNLFAFNRAMSSPADQGALSISCGPLLPERHGEQDIDAEYALGATHAALDSPHAEKDA